MNKLPRKERTVFLSILLVLLVIGFILFIIAMILISRTSLATINKLLPHEYVLGEDCPLQDKALYNELFSMNMANNYDFTFLEYLGNSVFSFDITTPIRISRMDFENRDFNEQFASEQGLRLWFVDRATVLDDLSQGSRYIYSKYLDDKLSEYDLASTEKFVRFADSTQYFCVGYDYTIISGPFNTNDPRVCLYRGPLYVDPMTNFVLNNGTDSMSITYTLSGTDFVKRYENYETMPDNPYSNLRGKVSLSSDGKTILQFSQVKRDLQ